MYYNHTMANIIEIECPDCHSSLWIDPERKVVIQHKKTKKKTFESFDSLLLKEKEKKEKADEKFLLAKELEKEKKKKAEAIFKKSIKKA
jgi:hypothetical protein